MRFFSIRNMLHAFLFFAMVAGTVPVMSVRIAEPLLNGSSSEYPTETVNELISGLRRSDTPELVADLPLPNLSVPAGIVRTFRWLAIEWRHRGHRLHNGMNAPLLT